MESKNKESDHPDRKNYTGQEIIKHLKEEAREEKKEKKLAEGELVTRADGTVAIKVKKRKRRTVQKKKNQSVKVHPFVKWALLTILIGLPILLLAIVLTIFVKYNGQEFTAKTQAEISRISGAQRVTISGLLVNPLKASAPKASLSWGNTSFLKDASFKTLKTEINPISFFSSKWIGEEISAQKGTIYLQNSQNARRRLNKNSSSPYSFGSLRCNELDLYFDSKNKASIRGLKNVAMRKNRKGDNQLIFQDGKIRVEDFPHLNLFTGFIDLNRQEAYTEMILKPGIKSSSTSELHIKGTLESSQIQAIKLKTSLVNFPIEVLLGERKLGRFFTGEIGGEMGSLIINLRKQGVEAISYIMPFQSVNLKLENFLFLRELKQLSNDSSYLNPSFNDCRGVIMYSQEGVSLKNLELISSGLITLRGNIFVNNKGTLSGRLEASVPEKLFYQEEKLPLAFSQEEKGYIKTIIRLGGSIQKPYDSFTEMMKLERETKLIKPKKPALIKPRRNPINPQL